jgi:hypothetical protein
MAQGTVVAVGSDMDGNKRELHTFEVVDTHAQA